MGKMAQCYRSYWQATGRTARGAIRFVAILAQFSQKMIIGDETAGYTGNRGASALNPFRQLTQAFIMTFGITPPQPEQEVRATLFICGMLFGLLALVVAVAALILRYTL